MHALDWVVVAAYLAAVGSVGFLVSRGQKSTRDYFLGGRSLPWWAAALSIIATETSAVTYIGVPRTGYSGDWSFLQLVLGFVLGRVFLAFVFVRVFYQREYLTVYGFLGHRFGEGARRAAALLFLLGRVVASGVRHYAGCLAVHVATGLPIVWVISALGAFATALALAGGIKTVVWTDVILGLTFTAGGLAAAVFLLDAIPGGLPAIVADPAFHEKLRVFRPFQDLADSSSFAAGLLGGFVLTLATHGTDQDIAQRILTCSSSRGGKMSLLGSAVLILPLMSLFLLVGTLLFYFEKLGSPPYVSPEDLNHLFPRFIVSALPLGLAGLVMAGLLAAAISSFTSVLNALAATTIGDFYRPLRSRRGAAGERHFVRASRLATAFWGAALVLTAIAFQGSQQNILDLALTVLTYFYGGLLGAFLLGILTSRGTSGSVTAGMLTSVPLVLLLQLRLFLAAPEKAPALIRDALELLPPAGAAAILEHVPAIAWPYWTIAGAALSLAIGALRKARGDLRAPTPSPPAPA
jgi:SSS family solute:Na+ symporter